MSLALYARLGLDRRADGEQIHRAWRREMRLAHPDLATDDEDRTRRELAARLLNEAYWTLGDPGRRAEYDAEEGGIRGRLRLPSFARRRPGPALRSEVRRRMAALGSNVGPAGRAAAFLRASAVGFLVDTRLGQWFLVTALALVPALLLPDPLGLTTGFVAAGLVAARLSRDGSPTPLADVAAASAALAAFVRAMLGLGGSAPDRHAWTSEPLIR